MEKEPNENSPEYEPSSKSNQGKSLPENAQIHSLLTKAWENRNHNVHKALQAAIDALILSEKAQDQLSEAKSYKMIGHCRMWLSENENALEAFGKAYAIFETLSEVEYTAGILYEMGCIYAKLDDYPNALNCHLRSFGICQTHRLASSEALALSGIGFVYENMNDYEKAIDYYSRSLDIWERLDEKWGQANALQNLGVILFERLAAPEEALLNFMKSLEFTLEIGDVRGTAKAFFLIGEVKRNQSKFNEAFQSYERASLIAENSGERFIQTQVQISIGKTYLAVKNVHEAVSVLKTSLGMAESLKSRDLKSKCHKALSEAFRFRGDFQDAYEHYVSFHTFRDEIHSEETERRIKNLQVRLETERAQKKAEVYRLKNFDLAQANTQLQQLKESLEDANKALFQASKLKTDLLGIAATELKEPINAIINFSKQLLEPNDLSLKRDQFAKLIYDLSLRMSHIISKLLNEDSIRDGIFKFSERPLGISNLVKLTSMKYQSIAKEQGASFNFKLDSNLILWGNEDLFKDALDRIFQNISKNLKLNQEVIISAKEINQESLELSFLLINSEVKNGDYGERKKSSPELIINFWLDDVIKRIILLHNGVIEEMQNECEQKLILIFPKEI